MKKTLAWVAIALMMAGCSSSENGGENGGEYMTPSFNYTYIRFVSPSGTNILDSLAVMETKKFRIETDDKLITISGIANIDNKPLKMETYWWYISPSTDFCPEEAEWPRDETLLQLYWVDFNTWDIEKRPYEYTEIYKIDMRSPVLFGDEETHTLRWYVNIVGRRYDAFKCEVDGQEVSLEDDILYKKGRRTVTAYLTIVRK